MWRDRCGLSKESHLNDNSMCRDIHQRWLPTKQPTTQSSPASCFIKASFHWNKIVLINSLRLNATYAHFPNFVQDMSRYCDLLKCSQERQNAFNAFFFFFVRALSLHNFFKWCFRQWLMIYARGAMLRFTMKATFLYASEKKKLLFLSAPQKTLRI